MTNASGKSRNDPRPESYAYPQWREAPLTPHRHEELVKLARAMAARDPSDPFAFGRFYLHLKRGIESPP